MPDTFNDSNQKACSLSSHLLRSPFIHSLFPCCHRILTRSPSSFSSIKTKCCVSSHHAQKGLHSLSYLRFALRFCDSNNGGTEQMHSVCCTLRSVLNYTAFRSRYKDTCSQISNRLWITWNPDNGTKLYKL